MLNASAVKALTKAGHAPDFPSTKHEGRTALAELCLYCRGERDISGLEETLDALHRAKADPMRKWHGKTAVFIALDNLEPERVLEKLVERVMWKQISKEENVYQEGDYFYSPTMYIKKGVLKGPQHQCAGLLHLLENSGATDRYYAQERFQQPPDATGQPANVIEFERKRLLREEQLAKEKEDHERRLQQKLEQAEQQAWLAEQAAQQRYMHKQIEHGQNLQHRQQAHDQALQHHQQTHAQGLNQKREQLQMKQFEVQTTSQLRRDIQWKEEQQKAAIEQNKREQALHHKRVEHQQKLRGLTQEQKLRQDHTTKMDKRKLQTQAQLDQQKAAAKLKQNRLAASGRKQLDNIAASGGMRRNEIAAAGRRKQLESTKAGFRAQLGFKKDAAEVQEYDHRRKMEELYAKRENMQLELMQKKFNADQRRVAQGTGIRRMLEG